jgi:hypothetical protein
VLNVRACSIKGGRETHVQNTQYYRQAPRVTASELRGVLSSCKVFTNFTDSNYDELAKEAKREFAPAGAQILRQEDFTETVTVIV